MLACTLPQARVGAGKTRSQKNARKCRTPEGQSHTSGARFVGWRFV